MPPLQLLESSSSEVHFSPSKTSVSTTGPVPTSGARGVSSGELTEAALVNFNDEEFYDTSSLDACQSMIQPVDIGYHSAMGHIGSLYQTPPVDYHTEHVQYHAPAYGGMLEPQGYVGVEMYTPANYPFHLCDDSSYSFPEGKYHYGSSYFTETPQNTAMNEPTSNPTVIDYSTKLRTDDSRQSFDNCTNPIQGQDGSCNAVEYSYGLSSYQCSCNYYCDSEIDSLANGQPGLPASNAVELSGNLASQIPMDSFFHPAVLP